MNGLQQLHWLPVEHRITFKLCMLMHLIHIGRAPRYMADSVQSIVESSRRSGLRSVDTADYVKHRLQSLKTMFDVVSSVDRPKTSIVVRRTLFQLRVRLPGTHYLTASSSSRTLVYLNSFSSLIYLILLFDILLAPLDNL